MRPVSPQCDIATDFSTFAEHYIKRRTADMLAKGWDLNRCNRQSSYMIGDKRMCTQHTGVYLCQKLTEGKLVIHD